MTKQQISVVKMQTRAILSALFGGDPQLNAEVADAIAPYVIADISETADLTHLADDEVCFDDILIAVRRVMADRLVNGIPEKKVEVTAVVYGNESYVIPTSVARQCIKDKSFAWVTGDDDKGEVYWWLVATLDDGNEMWMENGGGHLLIITQEEDSYYSYF